RLGRRLLRRRGRRRLLGGRGCPGDTGVVGPVRLLRGARRGRRGSRGSGAATQRDGGRAPTGALALEPPPSVNPPDLPPPGALGADPFDSDGACSCFSGAFSASADGAAFSDSAGFGVPPPRESEAAPPPGALALEPPPSVNPPALPPPGALGAEAPDRAAGDCSSVAG